MGWLVVAALLSGGPRADPCEQRCTEMVKVCSQQCEKNFPKDKHAPCKQACSGSAAGCKDQCRADGDEK